VLYQFSGRFVRDVQVAESIVQDVFVKIWTNRETLNITSNVKAYLYTAVKNYSLNHIKQTKRNVGIDDVFESEFASEFTPEDSLVKSENHDAVHKAISELPNQCRTIYVMKKFDDMSYIEIGEMLGISVNTVKTQMKRAMKALTEKLQYLKILIIFFLWS